LLTLFTGIGVTIAPDESHPQLVSTLSYPSTGSVPG